MVLFYLINGLAAGLILAAFLALCDGLFATNTFQVLIDISYVPQLAGLPSIIELAIHLILSILVAIALILFYPRKAERSPLRYLAAWVGIFFLLYFPFSLLSEQPLSITGFLVWGVGHLLYTIYLAYQIRKQQ